jgi:hypothetical protein
VIRPLTTYDDLPVWPQADYDRVVAERDVLRERVTAALLIDPADHATTSRDYGRGFAEAIRLVREALDG